MSTAPAQKLDLASGESLTLTGDIGGFRRFKAITRELGLGKEDKRTGKGRGISILSGELGKVDEDGDLLYPLTEELLPEFVAAFASTKEREILPAEAVELLEGIDVMETLDRIGDLMADCVPDDGEEDQELAEGDSARNQEPGDPTFVEAGDVVDLPGVGPVVLDEPARETDSGNPPEGETALQEEEEGSGVSI